MIVFSYPAQVGLISFVSSHSISVGVNITESKLKKDVYVLKLKKSFTIRNLKMIRYNKSLKQVDGFHHLYWFAFNG